MPQCGLARLPLFFPVRFTLALQRTTDSAVLVLEASPMQAVPPESAQEQARIIAWDLMQHMRMVAQSGAT